jgi:hypothetical protein
MDYLGEQGFAATITCQRNRLPKGVRHAVQIQTTRSHLQETDQQVTCASTDQTDRTSWGQSSQTLWTHMESNKLLQQLRILLPIC